MYDHKLPTIRKELLFVGNQHKVDLNKMLAGYFDVSGVKQGMADALNNIGYEEGRSRNETLKGVALFTAALAKLIGDYRNVFVEVKDLIDA